MQADTSLKRDGRLLNKKVSAGEKEHVFTRLKVAAILRFARKKLGRDIAPLKTLASHPDVLIPYTKFTLALDKAKLVPAKLKILGQLRAAKLVECPF